MNRSEKIIALLMRASAILLLSAVVPAVMPFAWMQAINRGLGLSELSPSPLVGYLTRSVSVMYAMHGAIVLFLSFDVRRYLPVVKCLAILGVIFGIAMLAIDCAVGMPLWWTVGEGPFIALLGMVWLWLVRRIDAAQ